MMLLAENSWIAVLAILLGIAFAFLTTYLIRTRARARREAESADRRQGAVAAAPSEALHASPNLADRLARTRDPLLTKLDRFFRRERGELSSQEWDEIEEALLEADVGVLTSNLLLERVRRHNTPGILRDQIREECEAIFREANGHAIEWDSHRPFVVNIVGVNGVGKTTTVGKIAHHFRALGKQVLLGAVDTFRAGAIAQLKTWAERTDSEFVAGREGSDPGAVAFDAVSAGKARGSDVVLLDTAGRLHTKSNLMDELSKVQRVIQKVIPDAPHETWLVVDGTLGQNSIQQAREFSKALPLTGIVVTKLDGTSRGGTVLGIAAELKLPIRFIGIGESQADLIPFEPVSFTHAILGG